LADRDNDDTADDGNDKPRKARAEAHARLARELQRGRNCAAAARAWLPFRRPARSPARAPAVGPAPGLDLPHDSSVVVRNSGSSHPREPGCRCLRHAASAGLWRVPELPELRARKAPMTIDPEPGTQPIPVQVPEP